MNLLEHNRAAWNQEVRDGNQWTIPVTKDVLDEAAGGQVTILLTPFKPVPNDWLGDLSGMEVLCLASGGGQQALPGGGRDVDHRHPEEVRRGGGLQLLPGGLGRQLPP